MILQYLERYHAPSNLLDQASQVSTSPIGGEPAQCNDSGLRSRIAEHNLTLAKLGEYGDPVDHSSVYSGEVTVFNRQPLPTSGIRRLEVMGMIGAGKDQVIDGIAQKKLPNVSFVEEPAKHILNTTNHVRRKICQVPGVRQELELEVIEKDKLLSTGGTIVYNRGPLDDKPFSRAQFIHGLLPSDVYYKQFANQEISLPNAVIVVLVSPLLGLKRKLCQLGRKEDEYSELLNPSFMAILYMQYLHTITDLISKDQPNLVIVNSNHPKEQVSFEALKVAQELLQ